MCPYNKFEIKEMLKKIDNQNVEKCLLEEKIKQNKLKRVDRRLQVIKMYLYGVCQKDIVAKSGYSREWVSKLISEYKRVGLEEFARHKYGGNHRALSNEEEREILDQFEESAQKGEVVVAARIKEAFDEKRGKNTGRGYIYWVLKRHRFRKIVPRKRHPKKASEAEIEASKKLTKD